MRVALVVDRFDPQGGGLEQWTVRLATHLLEANHHVEVVTFAHANHALLIPIHTIPHHTSPLIRARRIEAHLAPLNFDVTHDSGSGWSAEVFHPQTGSHLASLDREIASHTPLRRLKAALSPRTTLRRRRMARLESHQAANATRIIAVSNRLRTLLAARYAISPAQITVIPNGADTARYAPTLIAPHRDPARAALGITGTLFLGSAHNMRLKGMDNAIRALARLRAEGNDATLAIAGGTPDAYWHDLAAGQGVQHHVHFLGQVDDMAPLFAAADACVHPTRWDACSLSTIEAAAAALPVITTAMNGAAELIVDGQTGYVLQDPEDLDTLTTLMRGLLNPTLRTRIGQSAQAAAAHHDLHANLRAVEAVLQETATQRSDKPPATAPPTAPNTRPG